MSSHDPHVGEARNEVGPSSPRAVTLLGRGGVAADSARDFLERNGVAVRWTSQPGVFVAGDLRHGSIKRVASAVGDGAMAASLAHSFLAAAVAFDASR